MPDPNAIGSYLGDGVHASFDPEANLIWLMVQRVDDPFGERPQVRIDRVALEPEVLDALVAFACRCWQQEETT